jgi:SAM-dependent methyltransferase
MNDGPILELGCGIADDALALSREGASVVGVDISEIAIRAARTKLRGSGLDTDLRVMDAERLGFADASFGLVHGRSVLHHLDLVRAYAEICRTLRPGGVAVFLEPLGHNPLVNFYRRLTPRLRSYDERPLRVEDIALARRSFGSVETRYFHLVSILGVPLRRMRGFGLLLRLLELVDSLLLATHIRRWAWIAVITLGEPRTT